MRMTMLALLLLTFAAPWALAEEKTEAQAAYDAVMAEYQKAQATYREKSAEAKTDDERRQAYYDHYPKPADYSQRMWDIAEKHPDAPQAFEALKWLVTVARSGDLADKALRTIGEKHLDNDAVLQIVQRLGRSTLPSATMFLETALEKCDKNDIRGYACLGLAQHASQSAQFAEQLAGDENTEGLRSYLGETRATELEGADPEALRGKAAKLYERVVAEFGDVQGFRAPLGKTAERALYEMRNLRVGQKAPEIVGKDTDGVEFKLSDYHGKVVVLDFWGDW